MRRPEYRSIAIVMPQRVKAASDTFGSLVRAQRLAIKMTAYDFCKRALISQSMLSQVEHGKRNLQPPRWPALARALRLPLKVVAGWAGACPECGGTGLLPREKP